MGPLSYTGGDGIGLVEMLTRLTHILLYAMLRKWLKLVDNIYLSCYHGLPCTMARGGLRHCLPWNVISLTNGILATLVEKIQRVVA